MMFFSFARNSSSTPLSCGFTLGFIRSPKNKIARFQRSLRQNLAISSLENQMNSQSTVHCLGFLTGDFVLRQSWWANKLRPPAAAGGRYKGIQNPEAGWARLADRGGVGNFWVRDGFWDGQIGVR